ncbi:hypothetical protein CAEBREN_29712 [Caenorhabditis brenneri]|uniref:SXP/RAL-2 family protein Ani s 5-like cation-binding domain-containing protein n=1 Tax=Caenorhabditis brenneri TaxID=135651 RepID=G0PK11_CAEBE|nr:hypothetical protein CAEBREN_29712 [Caenorhabditis brenneri]
MCRLAILALLAVAAVSVYGQPAGGQDVPPFLRNATPAQLQSFQQLIQANGHLTETALDAKVQAWVTTQGGKVAADWADFQKFIKGQQGQAEAAHQAAIANFSPAAKKADAELTAISNDSSLSVQAKGQKIQAYLNSLPAGVKAELEKAQGQ